MVLDTVTNMPSLSTVLVNDTKYICFLSIFCNTIEWFKKACQVYDPETDMVLDAHFLHLNVNNLYNHNMNSVDLSDQL